MKKYFLIFLLLIILIDAHAKIIYSCNKDYSARVVGHSKLLVEHMGEKIGEIKINHDVAGGVFDSAGKVLVIYGLPYKVDLQNPQTEFLSIYLVNPKLHIIIRKIYGGGIYDVAVDANSDLIFISISCYV